MSRTSTKKQIIVNIYEKADNMENEDIHLIGSVLLDIVEGKNTETKREIFPQEPIILDYGYGKPTDKTQQSVN